jgi:pimeloyl-ACP methyl ester carboxylesterase
MTYVDVAGLRTWHEVEGDGPPVTLLHGAFAGAASFAAQTPELVKAGFRVHVPERRGHAHTPDVEGPLTYAVMADDTIHYLDQEVDGRSHLVGWSDGAIVALLVAQRRPDLVDRMVLIGQYFNSTGKITDGLAAQLLAAGDAAMPFLRAGYDGISPDGPDHFPVVFAKLIHMVETEPELDLAEFGSIATPALVLQGDRDDVRLEHSVAVVDALADARLAVLPGTHGLPVESPDAVNALIVSWLRGGPATFDWT